MELQINPKFQKYLFPLTQEEYTKLKESIQENGVLNPLITWNEYIVDGHTRYKICKELGITNIPTENKSFKNDEEVLEFMDKNQLGRRNLSDLQRNIIIGRLYECEKKKQGRPEVEQEIDDFFIDENTDPFVNVPKQRTSERLGEKLGVSDRTVLRAADSFKALEVIKKEDETTYNKIVSGELKINQRALPLIAEHYDEFKTVMEKYPERIGNIHNEIRREIQINAREKELDLGENEFVNMDSVQYINSLKDNSVDLFLSDPPFGLSYVDSTDAGHLNFKDDKDYALELLENTMKALKPKMKKNGHLYIFSSYTNLHEFQTIVRKYFDLDPMPLIWYKNSHPLTDYKLRYACNWEIILYARCSEPRYLNNTCSNAVLKFDIPNPKLHGCEKPIDLLEYLIKNSTIENELVVDCFAGSATTFQACINTNRIFHGSELDPDIYKVGKNRIVMK